MLHEHTGKLRPHRQTSYPGLLFLLLLVGILVMGASVGASGAVQNPQAGSVGLSGTVNGPPPSQAAVVVSPRSGSVTTTVPITVSGTCPRTTFISIEKNGVFAGAVECAGDGTFSLSVDLFAGVNRLVARVSDALGQFGPDSAAVLVTYNVPDNKSGPAVVGRQLFLQADETVLGGDVATALPFAVTIVGGTGPYAVSWDFGDGATSLESVGSDGQVSKNHAYTRPGTYHVIVQVTDSAGNSAFIQLLTVINGAAPVAGSNRGTGLGALPGTFVYIWPLLLLAAVLVLAFWAGERRQRHKDIVAARLAATF